MARLLPARHQLTPLHHRRAGAASAAGHPQGAQPRPVEGPPCEDGDGIWDGKAEISGWSMTPAALKVPEEVSRLLVDAHPEEFIAGVHRLSSRTRSIVELPERLDRAVQTAVKDTGHTHRQVKAKGRSLLEALKSISRGMLPPDTDEAAVKDWLANAERKSQPTSYEEDRGYFPLSDGMEWGARLSTRKQKRLVEGFTHDAELMLAGGPGSGRGRSGKGKKKPRAVSEASSSYGPLEAAAYAVTRLPMTFGAQQRVLEELKARSPGFDPRTLLDFGAGPAPALWAARRVFGLHFGALEAAAPRWGKTRQPGAYTTTTTLVDASPSMMAFTRRLAKLVYDDEDLEGGLGVEVCRFLSKPSGRPPPDPTPWGETGPVRTVAALTSLGPKATFDLVVAAYSLGEVALGSRQDQQQQILRGEAAQRKGRTAGEHQEKTAAQKRVEDTVLKLWSKVAPEGALVLIEPGTPRGSDLIRKARALVLEAERKEALKRVHKDKDNNSNEGVSVSVEAHVVAPCQHDRACPMDGLNTWCHFSQRVKRTDMHRQMLPRGRGPQYQDERFSYVVIRRISRAQAAVQTTEHAVRMAAEGFASGENRFEKEEEEVGLEEEKYCLNDEDGDTNYDKRKTMIGMHGFDKEGDLLEGGREDDEYEEDEKEDGEEEEEEDASDTLADALAVASSHEWGRMVRKPLKKSGHVIIDLCSAEGELTRHIVARSNACQNGVGKSGYRAARKSKWGDLWPYRDPRRLNDTNKDPDDVDDFFKDIGGVDMVQVKGETKPKGERATPIGVGNGKRSFMKKRPGLVEQYFQREKMEKGQYNVEDEAEEDKSP